jgi:hypothetical protein
MGRFGTSDRLSGARRDVFPQAFARRAFSVSTMRVMACRLGTLPAAAALRDIEPLYGGRE